MEILIPLKTDILEIFYLYIGRLGFVIKLFYVVEKDRSLLNITLTSYAIQLGVLFVRLFECCYDPNI